MAASAGSGSLPYTESADEHFHPKVKLPSKYSLEVTGEARESMPFADRPAEGKFDLNPYEVSDESNVIRGE